MIVAAGLGTRLRPLTELRPKPIVPVRGVPLIGYTLALLARHGVTEVVINAHHLPDQLIGAAREVCPDSLTLQFSIESDLLDTGGAIRHVAEFLRGSDPCLIVGADMLLDTNLTKLVASHHENRAAFTMLLKERDPHAEEFGTIGVDAHGCVRRIGSRFDLGGEVRSGVYTWANVVSARALSTLPDREVFNHLDDWLMPLLADGAGDIQAALAGPDDCIWEPVGTRAEYLAANLNLPPLSYIHSVIGATARYAGATEDVIIGEGATLGAGASLRRVVVWDGEAVTEGLRASDGVFAGGRFHSCAPEPGTGVDGGPGEESNSGNAGNFEVGADKQHGGADA
ncbi:MAG: sugar phosphate nucleotidyltransferase [Myxococcota bacterium]